MITPSFCDFDCTFTETLLLTDGSEIPMDTAIELIDEYRTFKFLYNDFSALT